MRQPTFFQVAAVTSSLLLAAGFVFYRAGAFHPNPGPDAAFAADIPTANSPAVMSSSKYITVTTAPASRELMSSTKSRVLITPAPTTPAAEPPSRVLFSGSKSAGGVLLTPPPAKTQPATAPNSPSK